MNALQITLIPEAWARRGQCAHTSNPDAFHASKKTPRHEVAAALELCAQCPVRRECLQEALSRDERFGIWGGLTAEERQALPA